METLIIIFETQTDHNITLKGGMLLYASHYKTNDSKIIRKTTDIDLDYNGTHDSCKNFIHNTVSSLNKRNKLNLTYKIKNIRGFDKSPNSTSVKLLITTKDNEVHEISIDINMDFKNPITTKFNVKDVSIKGYSIVEVVVDKLKVILSEKLPRRIKDLYDLYIITQLYDLESMKITKRFLNKYNKHNDNYNIETYVRTMGNSKIAYNKYIGLPTHLSYETINETVIEFITVILYNINGGIENYIWKRNTLGIKTWHQI